MSEAYKKFTAQDYAVVPFNAHKQYNFQSQSAHENQIRFYSVSWTSQSISMYSSASSFYGGDTIGLVKYNQLDHLFYKNFKDDTFNRFGYNNYLNHKRNLYEKAQILSIPAGLYGHEIKPGTFYLSSSTEEIIDDSYGNLIVSGTNTNNYPSDIRKNVFRLDPIKGFKAYDLDTIPGYAVKLRDPQNKEEGLTKRFWRRGVKHPIETENYTTDINLSEKDDSYYFNPFKYNKVTFEESKLGFGKYKYPSIKFNSIEGSHLMSPHNEKFNFNDEDFAISFWMEPESLGYKFYYSSSIGQEFGGGIIYSVDDSYIYIISNTPIGRYFGSNAWEWGNIGTTVGNIQSGPGNTPKLGDGFKQTENILISEGGTPGYLGGQVNNLTHNGYNDWYIPTLTEIHTAVTNLDIFTPSGVTNPPFSDVDLSLLADSLTGPIITNEFLTSTEHDANNYMVYQFGSLVGEITPKNIGTTGIGTTTTLPVRRFKRTPKVGDNDTTKRYIICKSGTKTVLNSDLNPSTQTIKNTATSGSSQPANVLSEPQFPFEIYMQSSSIYFARSDGDNTIAIEGRITGSSKHPERHHILCQKSSSVMQIHIDGNIAASIPDNLKKQTQNTANLYIGSKGHLSAKDGNNRLENTAFYNGTLSCINIFNNSFNTASIQNISESVNASPYVGNIFYQNGFATFTNPKQQDLDIPSTLPNITNSPVQSKRFHTFQYEGENKNPTNMILNQKMNFNNDGTKLYTTAQGRLRYVGGTLPPNRNPNPHIFEFSLSTPYDIHSADLDGDLTGWTNNPAVPPVGPSAYLLNSDGSLTKQAAAAISASYATVSSSMQSYFNNCVDFSFNNNGTKIFFVGDGHKTMSGSAHPTQADFIYGNGGNKLDGCYGNYTYCPEGKIDNNARVMGHLTEHTLSTPFDISSGSGGSIDFQNAKSEYLDHVEWHSHVNGYNEGLIDPATGLPIDETTPLYMTVRGGNPLCMTWSSDGYKLYTYHKTFLERNPYSAGGNSYKDRTGGAVDPFNAGLMSSFVLEEWCFTTPFDITSMETTGNYIWSDQNTNAARLGNLTTDILQSFGGDTKHWRFKRYGKIGASLDMTSLVSPEGYPIQVVSIQFNPTKTKMWLTSNMTSNSFPNGVAFAHGFLGNFDQTVGFGNSDGAKLASSSIDPSEAATRLREGSKIWEYDLLIPGNITTAKFNQTIKLGEKDGLWDRSWEGNDDTYNLGLTSGFMTVTDGDGFGDLLWHPNGESFGGTEPDSFFTLARKSRVIQHALFEGNSNPDAAQPYKLQFQGSHLIYEHEYQCTIDEHEFNDTLNITARKIQSNNSSELADFTSGSLFKPYITTVGLYDEEGELLVVGKLGQPVRASDETDTTIILRWDS